MSDWRDVPPISLDEAPLHRYASPGEPLCQRVVENGAEIDMPPYWDYRCRRCTIAARSLLVNRGDWFHDIRWASELIEWAERWRVWEAA